MSLPVPRSLRPKNNTKVPQGSLGVQAVTLHKVKVGKIELEHTFRPTHFVLHAFVESGAFPLNFGEKLKRVVYNGWPGAKEVKVEWIQDLRSYCLRVFQKERPEGWGEEQVDAMLKEGLGERATSVHL